MFTFAVHNEFTQLKKALVCRPTNYTQVKPINNVEEFYFKNDPPLREKLVAEHKVWTDLLETLGVELVYLKSKKGMPHQLFTRDVGFAVGEHFYLANMAKEVRKREANVLREWFETEAVPYRTIPEGFIEGGDVLVHFPYLYVGLSQRTDKKGIHALEKQVGSQWKVISIKLAPEVLHLDCVLAIINPGTMIWCPDLILSHKALLSGTFQHCIPVSREESFHMAVNVLTVNPDNILVGAGQMRLQMELKNVGVQVHPVDWSEIKKLGGLFRCATCPLA